MLIDIVILPPSNVRSAVQHFNKKLKAQFQLKWVVDNKKLIPHVSLYHIKIEKRKLSDVVNEVGKIAEGAKKIPVDFVGANGHYPYFGIKTTKSDELYILHKQVVGKLKDQRNGEMPFIHPPKTLLAKKYAKNYGAIGLFSKYNPHVTLGATNKVRDFLALMDNVNKNQKLFKNFTASIIAVAEVDKYWQVVRIIKKFKLKA
jgi:2'-5' RNA ligase